jgi:hypothetical protein
MVFLAAHEARADEPAITLRAPALDVGTLEVEARTFLALATGTVDDTCVTGAGGFGWAIGVFKRVRPRLSIGVSGYGIGFVGECSEHSTGTTTPNYAGAKMIDALGGLDGELRYHTLVTRRLDVSFGVATGFAFSQDPIFGPHLGAVFAFDVHPVRPFSIGLRATTGGYLFEHVYPSDLYAMTTLEITLAFHSGYASRPPQRPLVAQR